MLFFCGTSYRMPYRLIVSWCSGRGCSRPSFYRAAGPLRRGGQGGAELGDDAAGGADREPGAGVVVVFGEHGGALVDGVDDALGGPRHVELGVLELAGELLDQALAERGDVGGVPGRQLERGR